MQTAQGNMLLSLDAVDTFLDEHATELASVVVTGARQRLKTAIADLATFRSNQSGGALIAKSSTQSKAGLRKVLTRDHMAAIARIAKSELALAPEITSLRMPRGRPTIPKLVAAAEGMAKGAAPYISVFTDNGLPKDFIDQLNASATSLLVSASTHKNIQMLETIAAALGDLLTEVVFVGGATTALYIDDPAALIHRSPFRSVV